MTKEYSILQKNEEIMIGWTTIKKIKVEEKVLKKKIKIKESKTSSQEFKLVSIVSVKKKEKTHEKYCS